MIKRIPSGIGANDNIVGKISFLSSYMKIMSKLNSPRFDVIFLQLYKKSTSPFSHRFMMSGYFLSKYLINFFLSVIAIDG